MCAMCVILNKSVGDACVTPDPFADVSAMLAACCVCTQVMSVSEARACAVVDAGMKAVSLDSGPPQLLEGPNVATRLLAPAGDSSSGGGGLPAMSFEGVAYESGGECLFCPSNL